ncbi:MAG: hypothetical protein QY321_01795 [Patescibacteria group bacterium]|nr:MAG: hypothetical protein QY321_01795 [Patescibacteria group bacterium]
MKDKNSWPVIGHLPALIYFDRLLAFEKNQPGSIGGTYIISGDKFSGSLKALDEFRRRLSGLGDLDLIRLKKEDDKKEIGVAAVRSFVSSLNLSSLAGGYRIGIIEEADNLSLQAANALLKALEDGRSRLLFFLLTKNPDKLPSTVLSRSQIIYFRPVASDLIYQELLDKRKLNRNLAKNLSRLSSGLPELAERLADDKEFLETNLAPIKFFISSFGLRLYSKWQELEEIKFWEESSELERARFILSAWRLAVRDMMLLSLNLPNLLKYAFFEQELKALALNLSLAEIRQLDIILKEAEERLEANVGPAVVLESVMLTFA